MIGASYRPTAWSASALAQYAQCSARFRYERVLKLEPETLSGAAILGSAVHCALAWTRRRLANGAGPTRDEARAVFIETFIAMTLGEKQRIQIMRKKALGDLCEQGTALVEILYDHIDPDEKVLAIEQHFKLGITLSTGDLRDVVGVLDLIVQEPDGAITIVDIKSRARGFAGVDTDRDVQPSIYALAGRQLGATRFRYEGVIKKSRPTFEQSYVERDEASIDVLRRLIEAAERGLRAGVFLPAPGPLCAHCSYRARCREEWGQQVRVGRRLPLAVSSAA